MRLAHATKQVLTATVLAGSAALAGWGAGVAHAETFTPHQWCPGNPKQPPYVVNQFIDWDWSVCHTWYPTNYGMGNVTSQGSPISIWDGDNPPIEAITRKECPPISFMCP
ncbi:hypothetical protein [Mycobacterium sp. 23]|uniref:hypothetical protein n=1 Tax=Mycobacterium sp. 23 TaxID=3400424 RepID=UPI003AB09E6E